MSGGSVSMTVTVWLQKELFPQVSVDRQVRVTLNKAGQRGLAKMGTGARRVTVVTIAMSTLFKSHLSTAVGMSNAQASPHCACLSGAQWMSGGSVSMTVTVWLQKELFPQVSVDRQVRVTLNKAGQRGLA